MVPGKSPWEGEAPAEPKYTVRVQLSLFADNRSPGIPDTLDKRSPELSGLALCLRIPLDFKRAVGCVPGLKPRRRHLFHAFSLALRMARLPVSLGDCVYADAGHTYSNRLWIRRMAPLLGKVWNECTTNPFRSRSLQR